MSSPEPPIAEAPEAAQDEFVIEASRVSKRFRIYLNDRSRFFEFFGRRRHHQEHWALRDVSFQVRRGRSFGIIGANGAGKSTLLKLIAGISEPTTGELAVRAPLSTLLDLGLGFHANFSGRENIFLNCSLLGMSRAQIEDRLPAIIEFAELGEFIDYPVRTYSSGMSLRLGFAIAAHMDSEVFLVDEVLAVGDQYFQRKCVRKIEEFLGMGRTIVLVSHDLHAIRALCDEVMWLDGGEVCAVGPAREVVERYLDLDRARAAVKPTRPTLAPLPGGRALPPPPAPKYRATVDDPELRRAVSAACALPEAAEIWAAAAETEAYETYDGDTAVMIGSGEVRVLHVRVLDGRGTPRERFQSGESMIVAVTFRTTQPIERPILGVAIHRNDGVYVYGPNTRFDGVLDGTYDGIYTYFIHYPELRLLAGRYQLSIAVFDKSHYKPHVWHNRLHDFEVAQEVEDHGMVRLEHAWGLITHVEGEQADVGEEG
ncbi:MAG: ABC transporter ATP-binding protein [Alphaproteobacteria bacterium]|nr:ABC transporter ATP-binding protein [Alphaproteobacteria bacterium]MCB9794494.1 ABC transporter ATP-binding protein [Alphaproteobacteria bacterium]